MALWPQQGFTRISAFPPFHGLRANDSASADLLFNSDTEIHFAYDRHVSD